MTHGSLFSGIGGFDLAAEWMGWENVFHCEWNPFGQKVLQYYWPEAESFADITKTDFRKYAEKIDILTGGFPCQPYSNAGKRLGKEDDRYLWPHMLRAVREIKPRYVVGENVSGLVSWNEGMVFDEVHADLEAEGYEVQAVLLPACSKNAPHRRERVWFVAYSPSVGDTPSRESEETKGDGQDIAKAEGQGGVWSKRPYGFSGLQGDVAYSERIRSSREKHREKKSRFDPKTDKTNGWENFPTKSPICRGDDGFSSRLDGITFPKWRNESIKAYGNAIVPQVAFEIFKAIQEYENNI